MFDALHVLGHAWREGRLLFRDREVLEAYQQRQIGEHLRFVALHSPYTAQRFQAACLTLGGWQVLPPSQKADLMANFDRWNTAGIRLEDALRVARQAEDSRDFTPTLKTRQGQTAQGPVTGGPVTGGPVTVGLSTGTSGNQGVFLASRAERLQWAGVVLRRLLPTWPSGLLSGQRIAFFLRAEGGLYRTVQSRTMQFQFFDLLRPIPELARALTAFQPTLLVGPPSVLRAVAAAGAQARPQRVVSVAEVLEEDDKTLLEAHFGPVVQVYQATEGLLALPCPHGGLHLNEAHVHFDWEDLPGGYVRPIVTDFRRRTQPIIRHRLDDVLKLAQGCTCGLAAQRIERIVGRQDDALRLPGASGGVHGGVVTVWPDFLRGALGRVAQVQEYRLVQDGKTSLIAELDPLTADTQRQAQQEIIRALARCGVEVQAVQLQLRAWTPPPAGVKRRRVQRLFQGEDE